MIVAAKRKRIHVYEVDCQQKYKDLPDILKSSNINDIHIINYPDIMGLISELVEKEVKFGQLTIYVNKDLELDFSGNLVKTIRFALSECDSYNLTIKNDRHIHGLAFTNYHRLENSNKVLSMGDLVLDNCVCSLIHIGFLCEIQSITFTNPRNLDKLVLINGVVRKFVRGRDKKTSLTTSVNPSEPSQLSKLVLTKYPNKSNPDCCNYPHLTIMCIANIIDFTGLRMDRVTKLQIVAPFDFRTGKILDTACCIFDHDAFPNCISLTTPLMKLPEFPSLRFLNVESPKELVFNNAEMLYGALQKPTLKMKIRKESIDVDKLLETIQQSGPKSARKV